jgi:DNA-binding NarL/FixJ family response regulator
MTNVTPRRAASFHHGLVASRRLEPAGQDRDLRLVLFESHDVLREFYRQALTAAGNQVVAAVPSARSAHQAILEHRPDIAVIDSLLPDGPGLELCRSLRLAAPEVVLVFYTVADRPTETTQARSAGVRGVLEKNMRPGPLVIAVLVAAHQQ